ncbi:MAG: EAL domain-containing protein [Spongiibacteraceae bacterium]
MGLSSPELALLAVELLTALSLAILWLGDRERSYTLWWSIAHVTAPLPALVTGYLRSQTPLADVAALLTCVNVAIQVTAMVAGVLSYRAFKGLRWQNAVIWMVALSAAYFGAYEVVGPRATRLIVVSSMIIALFASATLMWRLGKIERLAAVCFAIRGGFEVLLAVFSITGWAQYSSWFGHSPAFSGLLAICTALSLLIAAYQRSLTRLQDQNRFLELSHEITEQLQGATDEADLAQRVLKVITQSLAWTQGVFFRPIVASDTITLIPIASRGQIEGRQVQIGVPIATPNVGMIATAVRTRQVCHSVNLMDDPRVTDTFRDHPLVATEPSMVVIPVTHDGSVLGIIVMRDAKRRDFPATEIRTLENLGQVIGISLANARNLYELAHRANHDTLTGLGNRAALHDYLSDKIDRHCAVMLFDLDHFKQVNDALGHAVGDKLLRAMADRLQAFLRGHPARLFRLGGDEFVVIHELIASTAHKEAQALSRDLFNIVAQPIEIGDLSLRTPASIGVALAPEHGDNSHELLRCADVAMYHAKQGGIGVAFYERDIDAYKLEHLTLLSAVNEGLQKDQFILLYQPIVNLTTGAIEGCEGLIRWQHPTRGLVGAAEFMPLVEATDLIRALTHRVIDIAMADAARWKQHGIDSRIAINLSARNILDPELPGYLLRAAERFDVEPRRIQLEITETILIKDPASATQVLQRLADAGFSLALDDFGTGYSSLAYLARFPIHTLKIDRSFVAEMLTHSQSRAIVEATIVLARGLGLSVTAEGVEHEAEAQLLRSLGCDCGQGYLFSAPIPEAQLTAIWWGTKAIGM